ncbi:ACT domain-containing protein [Streptomyces sp. TLI_146]|uniref:ACT domain-containing protein n=1 Tax=Streptomyces sp. TLI_146 TaxID=1938858 RepID=UPI00214AD47B|nr:ACT domain-containing protein [Streptomyces sp. TLI_146]
MITLRPADEQPTGEWLFAVHSPEGLTVVHPADPHRAADTTEAAQETWAPLYSGDTAHGQDVPGMLAALLTPLATGGVPVFVASTHDADLILVPESQLDLAARLLRAAGHRVAEAEAQHRSPTRSN